MASELSLSEYPRPSVAVDIAVSSVVPDRSGRNRLSLLVIERKTSTHRDVWSLPGSFVREREHLSAAVERTLRDKCGIEGLEPHQLRVLDDPNRDERGWVLSVAHLDTVSLDRAGELADRPGVAWAAVRSPGGKGRRSCLELPGDQAELPFDHEVISQIAIDEMRRRYREHPDPGRLMTGDFTVLDLRQLHEAVLDEPLQKDTFRRAMEPQLEQLDRREEGTVGRPARLFRRRPE